ncbi:alcohol dehydrogenase catalytic domain-containing protein [Cellulomonas edaphi]|uniref:Zinc-binding dehydrogenase n=1 Tax=Cellulomonas edaphi TaxID=3053468 RepID=A0ABT7S3B8_9CELL|nr:zinc-binding dehydrogenase [Cellulomons edaphi]MDM7830111.1 zinc-binding dehydrogenase [Cellulomons edaphi]
MPAVTVAVPGPDAVVDVVDVPVVEPGPRQVRVRVEAAPVTATDVSALRGRLPLRPADRYVLGWSLAGVVDAVGADVNDLEPGDPVLAMSDWFETLTGTQASSVVLPRTSVGRRPAALGPAEASVVALNALSAARALDLLDLPVGATLAVTGAAGSVGGFAIELARHRGLDVLAVAREADRAFVERTGATLAVRGTALDALQADGLLDSAVLGAPALAAVRDGGAFVAVTRPATPAPERGIRVTTLAVVSDAAATEALAVLAADGTITPRVAATYPLRDASAAYAEVEGGTGRRGGVVLVP